MNPTSMRSSTYVWNSSPQQGITPDITLVHCTFWMLNLWEFGGWQPSTTVQINSLDQTEPHLTEKFNICLQFKLAGRNYTRHFGTYGLTHQTSILIKMNWTCLRNLTSIHNLSWWQGLTPGFTQVQFAFQMANP